MLFERCNSYGGACPCLHCNKVFECSCGSDNTPAGYAVDTDLLCERAKAYCEAVNSKEDVSDG